MKINRRKRLVLLFFAVSLILIVCFLVWMDRDKAPSGDEEAIVKGSDLSIFDFQHTATEKGKVLWALKADRADYHKKDRLVGLISVKIDCFQDDGSKIIATSNKGLANTGTHDLELMESVEITSPDYRLKSEHLRYTAESKTFTSPGKTFIWGEGFAVEADSAKYEMVSGLLFLSGNVKGEIHESP